MSDLEEKEATGLDSLMASPATMVERSAEIANAFRPIVQERKLSVKIQGKDHIMIEGWTTLGMMLGIVPHEVSSKRNEDGSFEAVVELRTVVGDRKVGGASALCGTADDRPWNKRPEPARKSMACTRATGKAYRLGFSFIVKLAGYEVTPAEEMPQESRGDQAAASPSGAALREGRSGSFAAVALPPLPKRKPAADSGLTEKETLALESLKPGPAIRVPRDDAAVISDKQRKMLFALAKKANLSHEKLKGFLDVDFAVTSTKEIKMESFSQIIENIEGGAWK